jgi:hypothetical protein
VTYKIIAKCLSNRLRPILQEIIGPTQSAFVPGRLITDNALIAFECIHTIQHAKDKKGSFCAYKLDLSKAYDRVDWNFLELAMAKMGFDNKWIKWTMACVKSVRYRVRLNGALLEPFTPTRGLCQGDPLSPFLFLSVAEGLSKLIQKEIETNQLEELKIVRKLLVYLIFFSLTTVCSFSKPIWTKQLRLKRCCLLMRKARDNN